MRLPRGFVSSGIRAGIRKKRPDLALILAEGGANAAAVFTKNRFQAAPVVLSRRGLVRSKGRVTAVVANAGCANAITGEEGLAAARRVRSRAAELLRCPEAEVFLASTGVIGVCLPDKLLRDALPGAIARLSPSGLEATSHAILTTDVGPKVANATCMVGGKRVHVTGLAKGAGMIHPDMATMLAFVMTDAAATPAFLKSALKESVDASFNAISVDGDTSTNDTVLLMASGKSGSPVLGEGAEENSFRAALAKVCVALARMIVRDGEGASRLMKVTVIGAASVADARKVAHAVATSPLVKTALHGGDPNWGRILAAVGRCGVRVAPRRTALKVGSLTLVAGGQPVPYREKDAARIFSKKEVPLVIDLGSGSATATLLTCDLGHDYVSLNADYRS
jgi:glutamate N-acetyltransferase/amino-acid N-acetyltransferase